MHQHFKGLCIAYLYVFKTIHFFSTFDEVEQTVEMMQGEMKIEGREIERQRYAKEKIERLDQNFEAEIKMSLLAHFNWSRCLKNFSVKYLNSTTDETSQLCRQCNCEKLFLIYFW